VAVSRTNTVRGGGLLGGGKPGVGTLGAVGDGALDAPGVVIIGHRQAAPGTGTPRRVQDVGQQRQDARRCRHPRRTHGRHPRCPAPDVTEHDRDQILIDPRARLLRRVGDDHPELAFSHRGDQEPVLDRIGHHRVACTAGLVVSAHHQHHQSGGPFVGTVPSGRSRVQGGEERQPLVFIGTLDEKLLKLVDDQQQPSAAPCHSLARQPGAHGLGLRDLARGKSEVGRIGLQRLMCRGSVDSGQRRDAGQCGQRLPARGEHQARPPRRLRRASQPGTADARQHAGPQQR
jgi:hypothetical protein